MRLVRNLRFLFAVLAVVTLPVAYNNCSQFAMQGSEDLASSGSLGGLTNAQICAANDEAVIFQSSFYPLLQDKCVSCHVNGPGKGAFAHSQLDIAFGGFASAGMQKTIDNAESSGHAPPYTGAQNAPEFEMAREQYLNGLAVLAACRGGSVADNFDDQGRLETIAKPINSVIGDVNGVTVTWNLPADLKSPPPVDFPPITFSVKVVQSIQGGTSYLISKPTIAVLAPTGGNPAMDIHIKSLRSRINDLFTQHETTFLALDTYAYRGGLPNVLSSSSILLNVPTSASDTISFSIGSIEGANAPPLPPPVTVQFAQATKTVLTSPHATGPRRDQNSSSPTDPNVLTAGLVLNRQPDTPVSVLIKTSTVAKMRAANAPVITTNQSYTHTANSSTTVTWKLPSDISNPSGPIVPDIEITANFATDGSGQATMTTPVVRSKYEQVVAFDIKVLQDGTPLATNFNIPTVTAQPMGSNAPAVTTIVLPNGSSATHNYSLSIADVVKAPETRTRVYPANGAITKLRNKGISRFDWDYYINPSDLSLTYVPSPILSLSQNIPIRIARSDRNEPEEYLFLTIEPSATYTIGAVNQMIIKFPKQSESAPGDPTILRFSQLMATENNSGILGRNCIECHNSLSDEREGSFDLTDFDQMLGLPVVIPGQSANSALFNRMDGSRLNLLPMPKTGYIQDRDAIDAVADWIRDGAKNN